MDIISAILIIAADCTLAMAPGIDIDPIHLGIVFIVTLIGYLTPPLGLTSLCRYALQKLLVKLFAPSSHTRS